MHPKNPYCNNPPIFQRLGEEYPGFGKYVQTHPTTSKTSKGFIDFQNPQALFSLTKALLLRDFDIEVGWDWDGHWTVSQRSNGGVDNSNRLGVRGGAGFVGVDGVDGVDGRAGVEGDEVGEGVAGEVGAGQEREVKDGVGNDGEKEGEEEEGEEEEEQEGRICPTVANRLDYVLHLLDIYTYLRSSLPIFPSHQQSSTLLSPSYRSPPPFPIPPHTHGRNAEAGPSTVPSSRGRSSSTKPKAEAEADADASDNADIDASIKGRGRGEPMAATGVEGEYPSEGEGMGRGSERYVSNGVATREAKGKEGKKEDEGEGLKVLDIGTGATPIYPLLLARLRGRAEVHVTELNPRSLSLASQTLSLNATLSPRIHLHKAEEEGKVLGPLFVMEGLEDKPFTFTMCNPPFYGSREEMEESTAGKVGGKYSASTAAVNELITPGGEVAFIGRMIDESVEVRGRCLWFTSLIGKASSVSPLIAKLRSHRIDNYILMSIRQAHTMRWIVGWSFGDVRLPDRLTRTPAPSTVRFLPSPNTFVYEVLSTPTMGLEGLADIVVEQLRSSGVLPKSASSDTHNGQDDAASVMTGDARTGYWVLLQPTTMSWTRAARRQAARASGGDADNNNSGPALFEARLLVTRGIHERGVYSRRAGSRSMSPVRRDSGTEDKVEGKALNRSSASISNGKMTDTARADTAGGADDTLVIQLDWLRGRGEHRAALEGFWSFLIRKIGDTVKASR